MSKYERLRQLADENNGYLYTAQVQAEGISRTYLARYVKENHMEKVAKGVYISEDTWADELFLLQHAYPQVIFSGETALYLHGLIDREYTEICVSVPPGFNRTRLLERGVVIHQVKEELFELGVSFIETNYKNIVRVYDKERSICNMVKRRSEIDVQNYSAAIRAYMRERTKDLSRLVSYAEKLGVREEIMTYVEVMT